MVRKLLVFLIVVAALVVAADRTAAWAAGQVVGDRLARAYQLDRPPDVQVQGIPFLTQWSSGRYQEVDVRLPTVTTNRVSITNLSAQLHTVSTTAFATSSADLAGATIGEVDAQGVIPYSSIPLPQGFQVTPRGNQLQLSGSISASGVSVPVSAAVSVSVQNGSVQLAADQVTVPPAFSRLGLASVVNQQLRNSRTALQLPLGAHLDAVSVTANGLQVSASASQVRMPG
jgi:LmeA-like phospholipid-binding